MTEQEYINVKQITIISDTIRLLSYLRGEPSLVIPVSVLDDMLMELVRWQGKLTEKIKIKP